MFLKFELLQMNNVKCEIFIFYKNILLYFIKHSALKKVQIILKSVNYRFIH